MLSAAHRMRESSDFRIAMRHGRRAGTPHLVVHLAPAPGSDGEAMATPPPRAADPAAANPPVAAPLVGFAVSKQVGTAVTRNRVKRRLRHLVRDRLDRLPDGTRLVVRALPPSAGASSAELAVSLDSALARAGRQRPRGSR
ncbi:ribonuclease P protein component [Salana multivorans]|uniref:ribonuclease P protein component n=1 Tax=Salana multivorans TaxID=120377 RepID=UPI000F4C062A